MCSCEANFEEIRTKWFTKISRIKLNELKSYFNFELTFRIIKYCFTWLPPRRLQLYEYPADQIIFSFYFATFLSSNQLSIMMLISWIVISRNATERIVAGSWINTNNRLTRSNLSAVALTHFCRKKFRSFWKLECHSSIRTQKSV